MESSLKARKSALARLFPSRASDGNGTFTTSETGRFNGNPVQRTFTRPYVVNDDCTGCLDFSSNLTNPHHEAHGDFVIVDNGQEFFVVDNEEGWPCQRRW